MAAKIERFHPTSGLRVRQRFDEFIKWGSPFGRAGINAIHAEGYNASDPWFDYSTKYLPHGHQNTRAWFLKREYLGRDREIFARARGESLPKILNRAGLIKGKYLPFAKAYLNVLTYYRGLRTPGKALIRALIFLEKALRDLNAGDNNPSLIGKRTFERAIRDLEQSEYAQGLKYDTGKELEVMAGMLQTGHHTKTFRYGGRGFRLLASPFAFRSPIPNRLRRRAIARNTEDLKGEDAARITSEEVAAVGLAYRKALETHGATSPITFMAAIAGLSLTTVSMRMSELIVLARDALYHKPGTGSDTGRYRLRISRPKIGEQQDLPLPHKVSGLAKELFGLVLRYSRRAQEAFKFYIEKYGDNFAAIDELYVPRHLRKYFAKEYLTQRDVNYIFGLDEDVSNRKPPFPQRLRHIKVYRYVNKPGDISDLVANQRARAAPLMRIADVERACKRAGIATNFLNRIDKTQYIDKRSCARLLQRLGIRFRGRTSLLDSLYANGRCAQKYIKSADLRVFLLAQFKSRRFPHWPYVTKERTVRLDNALLVQFAVDTDPTASDARKGMWWCPTPVTGGAINTWLSSYEGGAPMLFEKLGIRLANGSYPSITLHKVRKYHHTEALLAGANEVFIDTLAGRRTGRQSDHYDLRTPREIIAQSIETFDPDEDFEAVGPAVKGAPPRVKIIERKVFLFENAAPKQITEVGGCRSDWSINPCEQYGDCMRCDKSVWRKGDRKRLPFIKELRDFSLSMISVAEEKIRNGNTHDPIRRHLQQYKDTLARCEAILAAEADPSINVGAIVTFAAPESAFSASQLTSRLRAEQCRCG